MVGGKAYFLSQGEPVNCWQWIDELLALVNLPPVRKSLSLAAARRVGMACEAAWTIAGLKSEPPMTRFLASQLATSHWFDISAARRDFGYEPRVTTAEGMRRLGEWLAKLAVGRGFAAFAVGGGPITIARLPKTSTPARAPRGHVWRGRSSGPYQFSDAERQQILRSHAERGNESGETTSCCELIPAANFASNTSARP